MLTGRNVIIAVFTLLAGGCAARPMSTPVAEIVTVSRLNPDDEDAPPDQSRPLLYGFDRLARTSATDADLAVRLKAAITDPATYDGPARGRCFKPRLVVRIQRAEWWTDYVICSECHRVDIHRQGSPVESLMITPAAADTFDALMLRLFPQYVPHANPA